MKLMCYANQKNFPRHKAHEGAVSKYYLKKKRCRHIFSHMFIIALKGYTA